MPYLERSSATLYYEEAGQGEPILTTHGLSENTTYWSLPGITDALAARFRVISMDMRGHGRSVVTGEPGFDVDTMAGDIGALADALGLSRFHLLAHATGGMVALRYARAHGDRLRSLLLTDTGSETAFTPDAALMAQIREGLARHFEGRDWPAILADHRKNPAPFMTRLDSAARPLQAWAIIDAVQRAGDPNTLGAFCRSFYVDPDAHVSELRAIACPTLVLLGEHDQAFLAASALLAAEIPNAVHVVMPGLGHMTAIEDPDGLLRELLSFLDRVAA